MTKKIKLPRSGLASLQSWDSNGMQQVAVQYDLSRRGQRQALVNYYNHERSRGRKACITILKAALDEQAA